MSAEVVVTGIGAVTALGTTASETWTGLIDGSTGVGALERFDPESADLRARAAAEIDTTDWSTQQPRQGRYTELCRHAVEEAATVARVTPRATSAERFGVSIGTGFGGLVEERSDRMDAFRAVRSLPAMAAGHISETFDARGPIAAPATACAAGSHAIGTAMRAIRTGRADLMIAGGAEAPVTPAGVGQFDAMRALATSHHPEAAARPFDVDRDGFVVGEGAGALVLESRESAAEREVSPLATLVSAARTADAHHPTQPPEDAHGLRRAIELALERGAVDPPSIDLVCAHAPGTPRGDVHEATAINRTFPESPPVTSVKGALGHTLGAAGAIEAVVSVQSLLSQTIPGTRNCDRRDTECAVPVVTASDTGDIQRVLSNAAGFGGANGVLLFERNPGVPADPGGTRRRKERT